MNLSTIFSITSASRFLNLIIASNLFLNSGANKFLIATASSPNLFFFPNPIGAFAKSAAPALDVIIKIIFLKSIVFPL